MLERTVDNQPHAAGKRQAPSSRAEARVGSAEAAFDIGIDTAGAGAGAGVGAGADTGAVDPTVARAQGKAATTKEGRPKRKAYLVGRSGAHAPRVAGGFVVGSGLSRASYLR